MENLDYEATLATGTILSIVLIGLLILIAFYILNAIAVSAIAKKNGYDKHWLAWIPFANAFVLPILVKNHVNEIFKGNFVVVFAVTYALSIIFSDSFGLAIIPGILTYYAFFIVTKWYSRNPGWHLFLSIITLGISMPISLLRFKNRENLFAEVQEKDVI